MMPENCSERRSEKKSGRGSKLGTGEGEVKKKEG